MSNGHRSLAVVHRIPGRLRLRIPPHGRTTGLAEAVGALDGVTAVKWAPRTRGLLVLHNREADSQSIVDTIAEHVGLDVEAEAKVVTNDARPTLAATVTESFRQIDHRVARATRGAVTLGTLLPVALTLWAGRELLRGRAAPLAWSSALWYAHGLFRDYNLSDQR